MLKSLLNLLDKKYENKNNKEEKNFMSKLNKLGQTEKKKTLELLYKNKKRVFQYKWNEEYKNYSNDNQMVNIMMSNKINKPITYEEKYQNLKNKYYTIVRSSGSTDEYYRNKYFNDYVDGRCPNLKNLDKISCDMNLNANKKNNKLYHSYDKLYDTKGKNNFTSFNKKLNEYNCYNYRMILDCIDTKLNDIKNNKINEKVKSKHKTNSDDWNINRNELNVCCLKSNSKNEKKYSRYLRVKNILEEIKEGIDSIKNRRNQRK